MKVFISSVIGGFEQYRDAASRAARTLRHEVRRSEDFGASPASPQQTCLAGVRWADVVVLLVGARYGERQRSEISATHEEYREARGTRDVLAFVQQGTQRESAQEEFLREVRDVECRNVHERFPNSRGTRRGRRCEPSTSWSCPELEDPSMRRRCSVGRSRSCPGSVEAKRPWRSWLPPVRPRPFFVRQSSRTTASIAR